MAQAALLDGRVPWRRRTLSAVAVMTLAVAGARGTMAAGPRASDNGRMACGDAPPPPVRLHLIDRAGLSAGTRDELQRETLAPWRAAGATLEWAVQLPTRPPALGEPKDLYVFVVAEASETTGGQPPAMASILFVKGQPSTHITVHAGYVAGRLATMFLHERRLADQPRVLRDRVLGRVLGRAVAHEVGHFLSGSREHASAGLMRASHRIEHLLAPGHGSFRVSQPATPGCLVARIDEPR